MATSTPNKRSIRLPNVMAPSVVSVTADIIAKCVSLASSTVITYPSIDYSKAGQASVLNIEFQISSGSDATLMGFMAGWATRLGVALLDTDVVVGVTAVHP
jgi:hypothetical protein